MSQYPLWPAGRWAILPAAVAKERPAVEIIALIAQICWPGTSGHFFFRLFCFWVRYQSRSASEGPRWRFALGVTAAESCIQKWKSPSFLPGADR